MSGVFYFSCAVDGISFCSDKKPGRLTQEEIGTQRPSNPFRAIAKNKIPVKNGFFIFRARSMGFEPTIFPVTGGHVNQATPRPHIPKNSVAEVGIEPTTPAL